jgi:hypothetical protein
VTESLDKRWLRDGGVVEYTPPPAVESVRFVYRGVTDFSEWDTIQVGDIWDNVGYVVAFTDRQDALQELGDTERSVMFRIGITEGALVRDSGRFMLLSRHQLVKVDDIGDVDDNPREITVHTYRDGE